MPYEGRDVELDRILIPGIPLRTQVGVTEAERRHPQEIAVDLTLHLSLAAAAATDDLRRTVDYEAVCAAVTDVAAARPYHLIETIAGAIADEVLGTFDVEEVEVRVRKPGALRARDVPYAAVEIRRRRGG